MVNVEIKESAELHDFLTIADGRFRTKSKDDSNYELVNGGIVRYYAAKQYNVLRASIVSLGDLPCHVSLAMWAHRGTWELMGEVVVPDAWTSSFVQDVLQYHISASLHEWARTFPGYSLRIKYNQSVEPRED